MISNIMVLSKKYNWINLPRDATIDKIVASDSGYQIYYTSELGMIDESDKYHGFEFYMFKENEDINIKLNHDTESRKVLYADVVEGILILIVRWIKKS